MNNNIIDNRFENSLKISEEYSKILVNLGIYINDQDQLRKIGNKIKNLRVLEDKDYEELNLVQVEYYLSQLDTNNKMYERILYRLTVRRNELLDTDKNKNYDTLVSFEGITFLHAIKSVNNEMSKLLNEETISSTEEDLSFILSILNFLYLIMTSLLNLFVEDSLIKCDYNVSLLFDLVDSYETVNVSKEERLEMIRQIINLMIDINNDEYQHIYLLLLGREKLNWLLESSNMEELKWIKSYISTLNLNHYNKLTFDNIKKRLREKEEELSTH